MTRAHVRFARVLVLESLAPVAALVLAAGCAGTRPRPAAALPSPLPLPAAHSLGELPGGLGIVTIPGPAEQGAFGLFFAGGPLEDPPELGGLTELLVRAALLGTEGDPDPDTPPPKRLLRAGYDLVEVNDGSIFGWMVTGPAEGATAALEVLFDVATRPTFPATRLARVAQAARWEAEAEIGEDFQNAIGIAAGIALGLGRPLGLMARAEALTHLNRETMFRHWQRVARPERAVLVLSGAADTEAARTLARERGGTWAAGPSEPPPVYATCPAPKLTAHLVLAPDAGESPLRTFIALHAPGRGASGRPAIEAALKMLNRAPGGRVEAVVGPERAHTSTARLIDVGRGRGAGVALLLLGAVGKPREALMDLYHLTRMIGELPDNLPTPSERSAARAQLATDAAARWDHLLGRVLGAGRDALYAPPAPDAHELDRAFRDVFRREHVVVVGVGPSPLAEVLDKLGPVTIWNGEGAPVAGTRPFQCR